MNDINIHNNCFYFSCKHGYAGDLLHAFIKLLY